MNETRKQVEERAELEQRILAARDRDDTAMLGRLQAEYRSRNYPRTRVHAGGSTTLRSPSRHNGHRASASRSLPGVPIVPTVGATRSTVPVVFSADAQYQIRNAPIDAGLERGGWLVGRFAGGGIVIETATTVNLPFFPYRTTTCRLPTEDLQRWSEHFAKAGWSILGDWHCHPRYRAAGPEASEGDRRGWQVTADERSTPWLGMIVGGCDEFRDGGTDWRWPRYGGWLAQPGRTVIDPVHLELSQD
jgi:hypothetical protein